MQCPLPLQHYPVITLAHGAGGRLTQSLLEHVFWPAFANPILLQQHDSVKIILPSPHIAMTTDSFVVDPLFFPDSNIGHLSIYGTVNDLAMRGAKPLYLTASFILTEGLRLETLIAIVESMRQSALECEINIVAGDIKVIEKGEKASLYINTTGIGVLPNNLDLCPLKIETGDAILISGDIGRHGLSVLSARQNLNFEPPIISDCASLWPKVNTLLNHEILPRCLRDLTRGGLSSALIEIANTAGLSLYIEEKDIPVSPAVEAGCNVLGLDPLYVANEGRMVLFTPPQDIERTLSLLQQFPDCQDARHIGYVENTQQQNGRVVLKTAIGTHRSLSLFTGEQLPRIC